MSGISDLKQELLKQKEIIESRSGIVTVANLNPSPSEITDGILSIPSNDLSQSTATEADVAYGKTFYSKNAILKTGTAVQNQQAVDALFMSPYSVITYDDEIIYSFPENVVTTRKYCFDSNLNNATIIFNEGLEQLDDYTFHKAENFKYQNFEGIKNLKRIGTYCFYMASTEGINYANLPDSIETVGSYAFYKQNKEGLDFVFPPNLATLGQYVFMHNEHRVIQNSLDISKSTKLKNLPNYLFYNNAFNCSLYVPENIVSIATYFDYNGCFKSIELPSGLTTLANYCFGAVTSNPVSDYYLKKVVFKGETPPTFGKNVFALQNLENGLKIYVPDTAVEAYKAANIFSATYADYVYPMSEME